MIHTSWVDVLLTEYYRHKVSISEYEFLYISIILDAASPQTEIQNHMNPYRMVDSNHIKSMFPTKVQYL